MTRRFFRPALLLVICAALAVAAVACQSPGISASRIDKLESSVASVGTIATRVDALEGKDQGIDGQVGQLNQTVAALQASVDDLSKKLDTANSNEAALKKKVDTMASQAAAAAGAANKISSLEQKLTLLETRYNDHLRKYHGG